jgi:hypothetical protein
MDPITVEDHKKKKELKIKAELYRNNLSPNNRQRSSSNDFDAKYTEVLIDLGSEP